MCGRYTLKTSAKDLAREFHLLEVPGDLGPRYNLAPTQAAPIITAQEPRRLTLARWGLIPHWAKDPNVAHKLVNARAETLAEKPSFKQAFQQRRCLVPADGFYEWVHRGKQALPQYISLPGNRPMAFAGLYELWHAPHGLEVVTFTLVTVAANPFMAKIHDRMPLLLDEAARATWLAKDADPRALQALMQPWSGELQSWEVDRKVNTPGPDEPGLITPVGKQGQMDLW